MSNIDLATSKIGETLESDNLKCQLEKCQLEKCQLEVKSIKSDINDKSTNTLNEPPSSDTICSWDIASIIPSRKTFTIISLTSIVCGSLGYYYYYKR